MSEEGRQANAQYVPLPVTARGYGMHLNGTLKKAPRLVYGNGTNVIIRNLNDATTDVFDGHKGKVTVAKFHPNGEWVASGDDMGRVMVWAAKSKVTKKYGDIDYVQACRNVTDLNWSHDGQRIVAVGDGTDQKGKAFVWNSGSNIGVFSTHTKKILSCDFKQSRPFRIVTGGEDFQAQFWKGPPFKSEKTFKEHSRYVNCVRFSPDGSQLVTVGSDQKIFLYDGKTGEHIKELASADGHKGSIYSVSWSPDGKRILTSSSDKTAKIWDIEGSTVTTTFKFGGAKPTRLDFQVSALWLGDSLFTVDLRGFIYELDEQNPSTPKRVIAGHMGKAKQLSLDRANRKAFSCDGKGQVITWNLADGTPTAFGGKGHDEKIVNHSVVTSDGANVLSLDYPGKLFYTAVGSAEFGEKIDLRNAARGLAAANQNASLAAAVTTKELHILQDGKSVFSLSLDFEPSDKQGQIVAFSQDDTELSIGGNKGLVHQFSIDGTSAKKTGELKAHKKKVLSLEYSSNGQFLVTTDQDRYVFVWDRSDLSAPKNESGWRYHATGVTSSAWSPNGEVLATGSADRSIIVWKDAAQIKTSNRTKIDNAHFGSVVSLHWLDDSSLISLGDDGLVKVWEGL